MKVIEQQEFQQTYFEYLSKVSTRSVLQFAGDLMIPDPFSNPVRSQVTLRRSWPRSLLN